VLYASSFAVQGRRGLLELKKSERKKIILRALGIERLERMAEVAREYERQASATVAALRARVADVPEVNIAALRAELDAAEKSAEGARGRTRAARVALDRAVAAAADATRAAELAEQRRAAQARLDAATKRIGDTEGRIANNRAVLDRRAEIAAAVERAEAIDTALADSQDALHGKRRALDAARAAVTAASERLRECTSAQARAESDVGRLEARLRDRDQVLEAKGKLGEASDRVARISASVVSCEATVERLEALVVSGKDRRIGGLRSSLDLVRRDAKHADVGELARYAEEGLAEDNALEQDLSTAPGDLRNTRERLAVLRETLERARRECMTLERLAARATEIEQAQADLAEAKMRMAKAAEDADQARRDRDATSKAAEDAQAACTAEENRSRSFAREREGLAATLALRPRLEQAEARIEELSAGLPAGREAKALAETELASLPPVSAAAPVDVAAQERAVADAELQERAAGDQCVRLRGDIERAQEAAKKRAAMVAELAVEEGELADWSRLTRDLGKDGLQAMEIDAALPEVNATANELLHNAFGSRYTVELRTDRLSSDGKKVIEDLEVRVLDAEEGYDGPIEKYSGGQNVVVGEAISLAITVIACRRLGIERPSIIRDESGAALDASSAAAYVTMLRKAARMIGADKVFIVSHSESVQDMADAKILVSDGTVTVEA
jgi:exonuclease SbcC